MSSSDSFSRRDLAVIGVIAPDSDLSLTRKEAAAINGAKRNQTSSHATILTDTQLINEFATRCLVHGANIYAMERRAKVSVPKQHEFMYAGDCADAKRCETIDQLIEHFRGYHYDELLGWFYSSLNKVTPDVLYRFTVTDHTYPGHVLTTFSDNNWGSGSSYGKAGMTRVSAYTKQLLYVARDADARDTYLWSVNSEWGATSGIVAADRKAKGLPSYVDEKFDIEEYIENSLSHRDGAGAGYDRIYTAGSRKWRIQL